MANGTGVCDRETHELIKRYCWEELDLEGPPVYQPADEYGPAIRHEHRRCPVACCGSSLAEYFEVDGLAGVL